jgi:hypothetical protein
MPFSVHKLVESQARLFRMWAGASADPRRQEDCLSKGTPNMAMWLGCEVGLIEPCDSFYIY